MKKEALFKSPRWSDAILVFFLIFILAAAAHISIAHPLVLQRALFPFETTLVWYTTSCSPRSPHWLKPLHHDALWRNGSLSGQIAYISPQGEAFHCQRGWRDSLFGTPVTAKTRFRFASASKVLTADAVLAAAQDDALALDAPLLDYLPEIQVIDDDRVAQITLRQLLHHSAGFDRLITPDTMFGHGTEPWCPGNIDYLERVRLDFHPDERYAYGNLGYCLLGVVLERVSGKPFREWIASRYPLSEYGLVYLDGPYLPDEVRYDFRYSNFYMEDYYRHFSFDALSSSAGLSGSALGYAQLLHGVWMQETVNGLGPRLHDESMVAPCEREKLRSCYGYGLNIYQQSDDALVTYIQSGTLIGASALVVLDNQGGVLVWTGNGAPHNVQEAMDDLKTRTYEVLSGHYAVYVANSR